jgi:hypothetical protein
MNDFTTALADDLADLAGTMPTDPTRLSSVRRRARRLRSQQLASRGVKATATVALAVGGLAAVQSGPGGVDLVPAAGPTPSTLPSCAAVPAAEQTSDQQSTNGEAINGVGTITALPDANTVTVAALPGKEVPDVTFRLTDATSVTDGASPGRPQLHVGDPVVFVVSRTDDGPWTAEQLQVHPVDVKPPSGDAAARTLKESRTKDGRTKDGLTKDGMVKGIGTVHGPVTASAISLVVAEGPSQGQTLTAAVDGATQYLVGDTACAGANLAEGDSVGFLVRPTEAGYHLEAVQLR